MVRRIRVLRVVARATAAGLLSAAAVNGVPAGASAATGSAASAAPVFDCLTLASPTCYTPRQLRTAYGIQPLTARGIDGRGETVVLPEAALSPSQAPLTDVRQDLARYDSVFGLPTANLRVITSLAPGAAPYQASGEYAGDVEIVHAIAPLAAIRVILLPAEANENAAVGATDYAAALRMAPSLGGVVSLSAGASESCFTATEVATLHAALRFDQERHVTVVIAAGDTGAAQGSCTGTPSAGVDLPASDPLALSVGGTSLAASHVTGAYIGETVWNRPGSGIPGVIATGGGFSGIFARPAYQDGVPGIGTRRGVPDVASDADLETGLALVGVTDGEFAIAPGGGTSAGAPLWAGIVAMADQYAGRDLGFVNPAIYSIGRGPRYHQAFHDVTTGNNTVQIGSVTIDGYNAGPGWDPVTGWGSPDAQVLVPLLARHVTG